MPTNKNSVFPNTIKAGSASLTEGGLTKREYFSVQILSAILLNPNNSLPTNDCIEYSVNTADELIEELNKKSKKED